MIRLPTAGRGSWPRIAVLGFATLLFAGCGGSGEADAPPPDPATLDQGASLYATFCASCHQDDGSGGVGPAIADGRAVERVGGVGELSGFISEGGDQMPALGARLTPEEIEAIAQYVNNRL